MRKTIIISLGIFLVVIFACVGIAVTVFNVSAPERRSGVAQTGPTAIIVGARSVSAPETSPTPLPPAVQPTAVPDAVISQADAEEQLLINLYERINPSVVNIDVVLGNFQHPTLPDGEQPTVPTPEPGQEQFNPFFNPQGQGSGFVFSDKGYIITNNHVVDGATQVSVTFWDGIAYPAEIVGTDPDSDLAVIKVDAPTSHLVPVSWGNSDAVKVGQRAVAIGNPFGLAGTLTTGVISAKGRSLPSLDGIFQIPEILQTDAAVNPGNSGGPLLDSHGDVIGVVSAIVPRQLGDGERSFLGVGFAIPGNLAKKVIPGLIENGQFSHPWVGISGSTLTPEVAELMNLSHEQRGALVGAVYPRSPADDAGLRGGSERVTTSEGVRVEIGGDVIVAANGETVESFDDLISFLSREGDVGKTIKLTIIRDGETQDVDVTLAPRPSQDELFRQ